MAYSEAIAILNSPNFYNHKTRDINKFIEEIFPAIQLSKIEYAHEICFCGSNNKLHCDAQIKKNNNKIISVECTTSMRQYFYSKMQKYTKIYKNACFGPHSKVRYVNDKDIWFRIYAKGYKIHYLPQILVKGRIHAQQISHIMGYSYHNPEQDMFWGRSLEWLLENHADNYEFFLRYGRNAFMKSRNGDGERAFKRASEIDNRKKAFLALEKFAYKTGSALYRCLKKLYFYED
jgi:hypothetical protein